MTTELTGLISLTGSIVPISGSTPFALYDDDTDFQSDGPKTARWVCARLGGSLLQVELTWTGAYACFEESVSEYSTQVNNNNVRNWLTTFIGSSTGSDITGKFPINTFNFAKRYANSVATEVGAGGFYNWKTGSIVTSADVQYYDLQELWGVPSESGARLEVKEVWHYTPAAIQKFYSPYLSAAQLMVQSDFNNFGSMGYESPMYYMMPVYYDILRAQAIELSDTVRKSNYSYEVINNKLRITPVPTGAFKIFFRYTVNISPVSSDDTAFNDTFNGVSDASNIPYNFLTYSEINSMGKQWIRKYTLALCTELTGHIRRKYGTIPIPTGDISLDGDQLVQSGNEMKDNLIKELNEFLKETSNEALSERESDVSEKIQKQLNKIPLLPYIG